MASRHLSRWCCGLAGLALAAALGAQEPAAPKLVTAIEVRSDIANLDRAEVRRLTSISVGEPLSEEAVRRTLTNLYATGIPGQVEVYSRPEGEGVVAVVVLRANVVLDQVKVTGKLGLARRSLLELVGGGLGLPFAEERVVSGVYALQDFYREKGYLEAEVRVSVGYPDAARRRAQVLYQVASGPLTRLAEVKLEGDLGGLSREQLVSWLGLKPGSPYRPKDARERAERLRKKLLEAGYRLARVGEPTESLDREKHRVTLTYPLSPGPRVVVAVRGADQAELEKKDLLPFLGPDGYDEALVLQAVARIRRYYQEKGHYRVRVEPTTERRPGELELTLTVVPGPEYQLTSLAFEGNALVPTETLESLVASSPRRLLAFGSGHLVDEVVAADLTNLRAYYTLHGFGQARVEVPRVVEQGSELGLVFPIVEGPQQTVGELRFEGFSVLPPAQLERSLAAASLLSSGGPFHPLLLEDSVRLLRARYEEAGYGSAQVSSEVSWDTDSRVATVTFRALEGPRTLVDRVVVRGNRHTRAELVRRVVGLSPGDPVSRARLLEGQRDLYRLGAFSRAELALSPADPGATTRDVVVRLEEGKTRRVAYGLGYDTEDGFRGLLGFSQANVFGRGYTLGATARFSQRNSLARLTFDQPYPGWLGVPLSYALFTSDEERPSFRVRKTGVRLEAVRELGEHSRLGLIYDFRLVRTRLDAGLSTPGEGLRREDQNIRISSLIPNLLIDRRDDPVDPTRGGTTVVQLQYAFPLLTANEEFLKLFAQETQYWNFGRHGVLAGSLRIGGIEPFRTEQVDTTLPDSLPSARVSIAERFFAGGANSHRAFDRDELGVPGKTLVNGPVGGNGLLLGNLDYRFPVAGGVGGVVFLDAGNVWASWQDIDPRDARLGVGLGVRYASPIGPVRLEVGWKLDREHDEPGFAWFFWVGNPF